MKVIYLQTEVNRPEIAPRVVVSVDHPYFKPDDNILKYFIDQGRDPELNNNGEMNLNRYVELLNLEGIQIGTPIQDSCLIKI